MPTLRRIGRVYYSDLYISGRRVRDPLSTDKRVAEDKLADLVKQRDGSKYGGVVDIDWHSFKEKFLEHSRGNKKGTTPARDAAAISALERFQTPRKLSDINVEYFSRWSSARRRAGKGQATISRDLSAIKAMLRVAKSWGYLIEPHLEAVKTPQSTKGRLIFWTVPELRVLLQRCRIEYPDKSRNKTPHDWLTTGMLAARAGLRRGEILHSAWTDLRGNVLSVTPKDCSCCPSGRWEPKDYEQRHIPIPPDLINHLKKLPRTTEWMLGERPSKGTVTTYFRRIVRKAGLKGSLHTARHTYASHLAMAGVPIYTISKLLGHSSVETTMIYAHLAPSALNDAVSKLPRL